MKHHYISYCVGVILLWMCAACSQVTINEQVTQSPYAGLTFKYVWGEDVPDDRKEMILIMNRIQYTQHYIETLGADGLPVAEVPATAWAWGTRTDDAGAGDTSGEGKEQEEVTADEEEDGQTSEDPEEAETAGEKEDGLFVDGVYQVKAGEYIFCTLSTLQEGMEIPGLTDFEASTAVSYNELKFSLNVGKSFIPISFTFYNPLPVTTVQMVYIIIFKSVANEMFSMYITSMPARFSRSMPSSSRYFSE